MLAYPVFQLLHILQRDLGRGDKAADAAPAESMADYAAELEESYKAFDQRSSQISWGALCLLNLALAYARFALQFWRAALEAALPA